MLSVGFYEDTVFPHLMDLTMRGKPFQRERAVALKPAFGDVLEIGFGTGLNLPHYPGAVRTLSVLDPAEIRAQATGPYILVDVEDQSSEKIAITPQLREKYNARMQTFLSDAETFCRRQQIEYLPALTTDSFEDIVLQYLRSGAFLH